MCVCVAFTLKRVKDGWHFLTLIPETLVNGGGWDLTTSHERTHSQVSHLPLEPFTPLRRSTEQNRMCLRSVTVHQGVHWSAHIRAESG